MRALDIHWNYTMLNQAILTYWLQANEGEALGVIFTTIIVLLAIFSVVGLVVVLPIYTIYNYLKFEMGSGFDEELSEKDQLILKTYAEQHNPFFRQLNGVAKIRFVKRLIHICSTKEFAIHDSLSNHLRIKAVIGSAFVQMTFGYKRYELESFHKVVVMPNIFSFKRFKKKFRGLTTESGVIYLSWPHVDHGYQVEDDKINLAIHELAHAFKLEVMDNAYTMSPVYAEWIQLAMDITMRMEKGEFDFFRKRAVANLDEFFAVSMEVFFEDPVGFKNTHPRLFMLTVALMKQNPLRPNTILNK